MRSRQTNNSEYNSPEAKYLLSKDESTLRALLNGVKTEAEARKYLGECNRLGIEDWRRERVIEWLRNNP